MIKEIETKAGGAIAQPQVAAAVQTSGRQFVERAGDDYEVTAAGKEWFGK